METLDKRHESKRGSSWIEGKRRIIGSPSIRPAPDGCPQSFLMPASSPVPATVNSSSEESADFDPNAYD